MKLVQEHLHNLQREKKILILRNTWAMDVKGISVNIEFIVRETREGTKNATICISGNGRDPGAVQNAVRATINQYV
jgi:hypothetical protein